MLYRNHDMKKVITHIIALEERKVTKIRNQYNQVPQLTQNTAGESDKNTNESQEVSPFPAGDHKAAMNRRKRMTNTRHK